jgi:elongation factor Ts
MAEISAASVKELRERTGAGMMDCKKALSECGGDLEKAIEYLREKGLAAAAKKAGRIAAEGLVNAYISDDKKVGVLVEVNCETDFVAKNPDFQKFVSDVAQLVAAKSPADIAALSELKMADGKTVSEQVTALISTIGENMAVRRFARFQISNGVVDSYIHMGGKIGVLIEVATAKAETAANPDFLILVKDLAMQVAAAKPDYIKRELVPAAILDQEKAIYKAQAMNEARNRVGAGKKRVEITDKEWEAIQAGAISTNKLSQILSNTDLDLIKQLATPRSDINITPAKKAKAESMLERGYTQAEVADSLGISVSTLAKVIK